jgi:hypothetical protein
VHATTIVALPSACTVAAPQHHGRWISMRARARERERERERKREREKERERNERDGARVRAIPKPSHGVTHLAQNVLDLGVDRLEALRIVRER